MWLMKSIDQRQRTIYKVATSIVKFQRGFLDLGIEHLRPLVLKDVDWCKRYLQQHRYRVTVTGRHYLFVTATTINSGSGE